MEAGVRVVRGVLQQREDAGLVESDHALQSLWMKVGTVRPPATAGWESWGLRARSLKSGGHKR